MRFASISCVVVPLLLTMTHAWDGAASAGRSPNEALLEEMNLYFGVEVLDPDGQPMDVAENRLRSTLERLGLMIRESSPYQLRGQADVVDEKEVTGGFTGSKYAVAMELDLYLEDMRDGQILGSAGFSSKGMAETKEKAVKKAVKNLKFRSEELVELRDRALERVALILDEECDRSYGEAQKLYDQRQFRQALVPLSDIVPSATVYPKAQELKTKINTALWRQEENRVKEAQAKAKIEEEKRMQALHKAQEAEARAKAKRDSLEAAKIEERMQEHEILLLEKRIKLAEQEKEIAHVELAKTLASYEQAVGGLDAAMEPTRPPIDREDPGGRSSPWEPKSSVGKEGIAGKWEFIKDESSVKGCRIEAQTLELSPNGDVTVWLVGSDSDIVVGRGSFSVNGGDLTLDFEDGNVGKYVDRSYGVMLRGDSRLYLVDDSGNKFAFCRMTT